ncbi:MAG: cell division protein FtsK [Actinomycetota bacterium]|nr:cell division protein FtsK [Actinomycetota bacterium]
MRVARWLLRHPGFALGPVALVWAVLRFGATPVGCTVAGVVLVVLVWGRGHPATFDRWAAPRLRSMKRRWFDYRGRRWSDVLGDCELSREDRRTGELVVPRVEKVRAVTPSIDTIRVRLARGQDVKTWTDQSEALAHALCAERVAVAKYRPGRLTLVVERVDPFPWVLPAPPIPATSAEVDLRALDIGDTEYGTPATVSVTDGSHLLGVGATGTGKSGLEWGTLRQVGPMIRDGVVRVRMIDLKGGTETEAGRDLFYRYATTVEEAIRLLTEVHDDMKAAQEQQRLAGRRKDTPSVDTPQDLVYIDELAMLTAYGKREHVREALRLLAVIMTQGRSTLFTVLGFLQEPSKDILEVRELFTSRICLGVTAASHVDMTLGEGARDRGALADEIPLDEEHAGIGFRIDKGSRLPTRLRLGYSQDVDIAELARLCAPTRRLTSVKTNGADEAVA